MTLELPVAIIVSLVLVFITLCVTRLTYKWYQWNFRLHPDTLRMRCEDELGGVLIGGHCFKREALVWKSHGGFTRRARFGKNIEMIDGNYRGKK